MIPLERRETCYGTVTIFRRKLTGALVYDLSGSPQSEADQSGISLASYVHAIYDFLLQNDARSVLMIGCGGGTLGTMLVRVARKVAIVDVNPDAFDLAKRYFGLPLGIACHLADGRDYLLAHSERYDAIVLDAFHGDHVPAHLRTLAFLRLVFARLEHRGMFLANVHVKDDADRTPDQVAQAAANIWQDVRLLDATGYCNRNAIVAAGNVQRLRKPALRLRPNESVNEIAHELNTSHFRPWRVL